MHDKTRNTLKFGPLCVLKPNRHLEEAGIKYVWGLKLLQKWIQWRYFQYLLLVQYKLNEYNVEALWRKGDRTNLTRLK
jgi:hypothetical protein